MSRIGTLLGGETFQSTPSARRATQAVLNREIYAQDFNPRPPRGERRANRMEMELPYHISIHALREESDQSAFIACSVSAEFQSTPSARRATCSAGQSARRMPISIHALREESDRSASAPCRSAGHFNPRPPRGERPFRVAGQCLLDGISIHALREESDSCCRSSATYQPISIHALREESDPPCLALTGAARDFNPRPPRGERPHGRGHG